MLVRSLRVVALSALLAAAGCGGRNPDLPETTPVIGKITYQGEPVTRGTITFRSDSGHTATGEIQPDGTYILGTFSEGDGAVLGHHNVMIVSSTADPNSMPGSSPGYEPPQALIPPKYANPSTSGLEANVTEDNEPIDFDLQ